MLTITYYFLMAITINGASASGEVVNKYESKKACESAMQGHHRELAESVPGDLVCVKVVIKKGGKDEAK